jgi:hypothetical protein
VREPSWLPFTQENAMTPLAEWDNFYVIVGSSAGALTGLMFVVVTLIADRRAHGGGGDVAAYGTPNVFHFCAVLLVSAMLAAPWQSLHVVGVLLVIAGAIGVAYAAIILRRMVQRAHLENTYTPVAEDWLWFGVFPFTAYIALAVAALIFLADPPFALFIVGAALLLLIVIGIHNAWDSITFIATERIQSRDENKEKDGRK